MRGKYDIIQPRKRKATVAQLDRALASEAEGCGFEPRQSHQLKFIYEDDDIIVINKPAGLLTTHTKVVGRVARESQATAENILNDYVRKGQWKSKKRVWLVHRLDRETSGVMMFAKREDVAEWYRDNWGKLTEKIYLAKVEGKMESESGVYESYLVEDQKTFRVFSIGHGEVERGRKDAKLAKTEWRVLNTTRNYTEVEVKLHSGRKNQIRVHFSEHGHPVLGDRKYGGKAADRMYLHAKELKVKMRDGEWKTFCA